MAPRPQRGRRLASHLVWGLDHRGNAVSDPRTTPASPAFLLVVLARSACTFRDLTEGPGALPSWLMSWWRGGAHQLGNPVGGP